MRVGVWARVGVRGRVGVRAAFSKLRKRQKKNEKKLNRLLFLARGGLNYSVLKTGRKNIQNNTTQHNDANDNKGNHRPAARSSYGQQQRVQRATQRVRAENRGLRRRA